MRNPFKTLSKPILAFALFALISTLISDPAQAQVPLTHTQVQVPTGLQSSPFDTPRYLNIPSGFQVSVYARISGARFIALAPNGDLLVSQPGGGKVKLLRANGTGPAIVSDFVTGLNQPHDIVFHKIGTTTYVYIAEKNEINRYIYNNGDLTAHDRQIVISNLPDASLSELHGVYGHQLKNIALDSNNKLYVSIASATNADLSDTTASPVRGAIYQYNADGTGGRLYARGLRNAEGLAFLPGTTTLWVCVNNRDNIGYPFHNDWDGDGTDDYGKTMQSYVDNHPTEEFTHLRDGGNYGWPFANPNPDTASGVNQMPFDLDVQNNADGSHGAASSFDRIDKGIQAHSAPLGLMFLQNTPFPSTYRSGALIALHGSWNRTVKTGYKVIYFPWDTSSQQPGPQTDFVTGWLDDAAQQSWGRPVDTAVDLAGNLYVTDDTSGTVYKLTAPISTAPTNVTATPLNSSQIKLTWNAVLGATSYYVFRSSSAGGYHSYVGSSSATTYTDSGLSTSTPYYYIVVAVNSAGSGPKSPEVHATTLATSGPPGAPTNVQATAVSSSQIKLTWNAVSGATSYYVFRSGSAGAYHNYVGSSTTPSFTNSGLVSGTTYYYIVVANNSNGSGPKSAETPGTTQ